MALHSWVEEFPGAITVCDTEGTIIEMNKKAEEVFKADGGIKLIGSNVLDCHPEAARKQLQQMMETQSPNTYTIEKGEKKKLIFQTPFYEKGMYAGFVELSLEIPAEMPHFKRS